MANEETLQDINPGSFNQFCARGEYGSHEEALGAYSLALAEYRHVLATERGMTLEDLHAGPFDY